MNTKRSCRIAPSILSADFSDLKKQVRLVEKGGADWIHVDIMDGHFVPNISFGPMLVGTLRKLTRLPLDTHLMISHPDEFLEAFKKAGAHRLTVHVESTPHLHRTVQRIRSLGMRAGVTLNPSTPAAAIEEIIPYVDLVLVMTVNPGFGGQSFIASMYRKIREISRMIARLNPGIHLEVDGGVDETNAARVVASGANVLVAGNAVFTKKNISAAVRQIKAAANG